MSDSRILLKCQCCGYEWYEDVERLKQAQTSIYKTLYRGFKPNDYRIPCPKCGAVKIVTVREEADDA